METYFNIRYEFDHDAVHQLVSEQLSKNESGYICVADGTVLNVANRDPEYLDVVNGSMFSISDSSYVPLYLKWIYGVKYQQYSGSEIFLDIINQKKYRMIFLGGVQNVLDGLKNEMSKIDARIKDMTFYELPFLPVDEFDYPAIAKMIEDDGADIVWVALGAPKQEIFMSKLKPHLNHGVMLGVGAVFKFFSGQDVKRAPQWMVKAHMEFIYRLFSEPKKQIKRCTAIIITLPSLLIGEWKRKRNSQG